MKFRTSLSRHSLGDGGTGTESILCDQLVIHLE